MCVAPTAIEGEVHWCSPAKVLERFGEDAKRPNFAVITIPQFYEEAKKIFGSGVYVTTICGSKGLEFDAGVLWKVFEAPEYLEIADLLKQAGTDAPEPKHQSKDTRQAWVRKIFDSSITAMTRIMRKLIIAEAPPTHHTKHLLRPLMDSTDSAVIPRPEIREIKSDSSERVEWIKFIEHLVKNGGPEAMSQAQGLWEAHLPDLSFREYMEKWQAKEPKIATRTTHKIPASEGPKKSLVETALPMPSSPVQAVDAQSKPKMPSVAKKPKKPQKPQNPQNPSDLTASKHEPQEKEDPSIFLLVFKNDIDSIRRLYLESGEINPGQISRGALKRLCTTPEMHKRCETLLSNMRSGLDPIVIMPIDLARMFGLSSVVKLFIILRVFQDRHKSSCTNFESELQKSLDLCCANGELYNPFPLLLKTRVAGAPFQDLLLANPEWITIFIRCFLKTHEAFIALDLDAFEVDFTINPDHKKLAILKSVQGAMKARGLFNSTFPLHDAAQYDSLPEISELIRLGADPSAINREGDTPLHLAAFSNKYDIIKLLSQSHGVDLNVQNNLGETAAHVAVKRGSREALHTLLELNCRMDIFSNDGLTPLHVAIKMNDCLTIVRMHRLGVNMDQKTRDGKSPMELVDGNSQSAIGLMLKNLKTQLKPSASSIFHPSLSTQQHSTDSEEPGPSGRS